MKTTQAHKGPKTRLHNRVAAVMLHTSRYASKGRSRLAKDCGVSKSAISRLINGRSKTTYWVMARVVDALEKELNRKLDVRELFSETGDYPTAFACSLCACKGCLPGYMYGEDNKIKPEYKGIKKGLWSGDIYELDGPFWQPIKEVK